LVIPSTCPSRIIYTASIPAITAQAVAKVRGPCMLRISLYNYSEDSTRIRFALQNNHAAAITFYEVRLQARCPDGTVAEAGGWSFDTLRTRAGQPDLREFAPLQIETIEPGNTHQFEFVRPVEASTTTVRGQVAETHTCQPSTLKDFTAIFMDGTGVGVRDLIDKQFVNWQSERDELKRWLASLHELRNAQDMSAATKNFQDRLNQAYDDCEDRALTDQRIIQCQMNREIWHQMNRTWQQLRSAPESGADTIARLVNYWDRVADLLEKQSSRRN
jgi:hypothetical protein